MITDHKMLPDQGLKLALFKDKSNILLRTDSPSIPSSGLDGIKEAQTQPELEPFLPPPKLTVLTSSHSY